MPEPTPSLDDPFADLFGKLPDPRTRATPTASGPVPTTPDAPAAASVASDAPTPPAPLSRRAAREAAAATGEQQVLPDPTASTAAPDAAPAATPPAGPGSVAAASATAEPPLPVQSAPTVIRASAAPIPPDTEPIGIADAAPVRPYARSGEIPVAAAEASDDRSAGSSARPSARPAATGSLDDLFSGRTSTDDIGAPPPPPDKRRRRVGGWIALGIVLLLLGGVAGGGWYVWTTYEDKIREFMGWEAPKDYEDGLAHGEAFVTVVSGDTGQSISPKLFDAGVTKTPEAFYDFLVDTAQNPPFVPGVFQLQKQMTSEAALAAILDPANKMEHTAQLREGLTVAQSLDILSESLGIPREDFEAAVQDPAAYGVTADPAVVAAGGQPLEGWLFPATYTFDPGVTAEQVIGTLVTRAMKSLDDAAVPDADRQRILTIASIIQREARFEEDFYKVSRVIQNRLDPSNQETFGKLQMDSTAQFGYGEMHDGTVSSSQEALDDPNPWNTYVHTGLPVGPIANPGDLAIDAAMHPADGPWLYFVTVNMDTGETIFTNTYSEHLKYVDQWQAWCKDHPDSGC